MLHARRVTQRGTWLARAARGAGCCLAPRAGLGRSRGANGHAGGGNVQMEISLESKVVVITGASSGFGKGAALAFAAERATVVVAARRDALLTELVERCNAAGGRAMSVPTDVSRADEVERLASKVIDEFGRIDVWINNAGVGALGPFERVPLADHVQVIQTSLLGTLYGSYYAYRRFLEQEEGVLINIASELGSTTVPYYTSYAAAKHGVVGLGDSLRQEIELKKLEAVHVCTVLPTAHDTPFFDHAANYTGHQIHAPEPLHDPQEVIDAIVSLAKDPKAKEIVGSDGVLKILMKKLAPGWSEKLGAKQMHKWQMEDAPPGADSPGAVRAPTSKGAGVRGGRKDK